MKRISAVLLTATLAAAACGCRGVAGPKLYAPGNEEAQQARAERFDPYPENEPGPAVVGSRPMEYQNPPPEVQRARWVPWSWKR